MEITPSGKPPMIRIVSGTPLDVERLVNELTADYAVQTWSVAVVNNAIVVTAIMLHGSIYRQAAIASGVPAANGRR